MLKYFNQVRGDLINIIFISIRLYVFTEIENSANYTNHSRRRELYRNKIKSANQILFLKVEQ